MAGTVTSQKDSLESPSSSHPHSAQRASTCPTPTMSPCLLGCVVFCLLQAGESWGAGSPSGPALSLCAVTAASVLLLHRGGPCWCHSGPQIPGREDRAEGDTEMHSGSEPRLYVPTRPGTRAEADPLLSCCSQHGERRRARGLQRLQTKHRRLPSHAGVCQPLPDICVLLRQQLLHGAARPPPFCAKSR